MDGSTNASNVGGTVGSDTKPIKIVDGKAVAVTDTLAKASQVPTKISSEFAQRVTYWRMPQASSWTTIYTNNTNNFMVGWVTLQATGGSGTWTFIVGGGNYTQGVALTDGAYLFLPMALPPGVSLNYTSNVFVNGWATLFELKLA